MLMNKVTIDFRKDQLMAMDNVIRCANDEELIETWLTYGPPDGATVEDFESIAENTESYNKCIDLFVELVGEKGYRA